MTFETACISVQFHQNLYYTVQKYNRMCTTGTKDPNQSVHMHKPEYIGAKAGPVGKQWKTWVV